MEIYRQNIRGERDIVRVRDRSRLICDELGFGTAERLQITTSVFELARKIVERAARGRISFDLLTEGDTITLSVIGADKGPVIPQEEIENALSGKSVPNGLLKGFQAMRRLMDEVGIESDPETGTVITLIRRRAGRSKSLAGNFVEFLADAFKTRETPSAAEELRLQNSNLAQTLSLYQEKTQELERRNQELQRLKTELERANERLQNQTVELQDNLLGLGDETAELALAHQRMKALIHFAPNAVAVTDTGAAVAFVNQAFMKQFDVEAADLIDSPLEDFVRILGGKVSASADAERIAESLRQARDAVVSESASGTLVLGPNPGESLGIAPLLDLTGRWLGHVWRAQ